MADARITKIIKLEEQADASGDKLRWQAAKLIAAEIDAGTKTRDLAKKIDKSQTHVSRMVRIWRDYGHNAESPETQPFHVLYASLSAKTPKPKEPTSLLKQTERYCAVLKDATDDELSAAIPLLQIALSDAMSRLGQQQAA